MHSRMARGRIAGLMLVVAGLIEGFVSPSELPLEVRLAVGPLAGLALYALLFTVGRAQRGANLANTGL